MNYNVLGFAKDRVVALLGWFVLKLVGKSGLLQFIANIDVCVQPGNAKRSVNLALLVTDADQHVFLLDLTHSRLYTFDDLYHAAVECSDGLPFDNGRFQIPSRFISLTERQLKRAVQYASKLYSKEFCLHPVGR